MPIEQLSLTSLLDTNAHADNRSEAEKIPDSRLSLLKKLTVFFRQDRPTLDTYHSLYPSRLFWLVWHEVKELNGQDKYGLFAQEEFLGLYRQQELADIIIYLQAVYDQLAENPDEIIFLDEDLILERAATIAQAHHIAVVDLDQPLKEPIVLNQNQEATYNQLKNNLNFWATVLDPAKADLWNGLSRTEQEMALNEVMSTAFVMLYLYGLNPLKASLEKIARNLLRYDPQLLQDNFSDILGDHSLSQEEKDGLINERYEAAIEACKVQFDGQLDSQGERPQLGTQQFYLGPLAPPYLDLLASENQKILQQNSPNHDRLERNGNNTGASKTS